MEAFSIFMIALIALAAFGLFFYTLVDILKNEFQGNNKIVWIIVVLIMPFIGSILYLLIGTDQKIGLE